MTQASRRPPHISKSDWEAVDVPPLAAEDFRQMRPAAEALPPQLQRAIGKRGPGKKPAKVAVSLRLDPDIVEAYRATGDGWQSLINTHLGALSKAAPLKRLKTVKGVRAATVKSGVKPSRARKASKRRAPPTEPAKKQG